MKFQAISAETYVPITFELTDIKTFYDDSNVMYVFADGRDRVSTPVLISTVACAELNDAKQKIQEAQATIARLNAEAHSLHAALAAEQTRANKAEKVIRVCFATVDNIYQQESTTSLHGMRIREEVGSLMQIIINYTHAQKG